MEDSERWRERLAVVGSAQGRYFALLALAGLFFYALDAQITSQSKDVDQVQLPLVSGRVAATTLQSTAPVVIGVLLLAVLGATRAVAEAAHHLSARGTDIPEHLDRTFNLIDATVYTTAQSPRWAARLASLAHPATLSVFWVEAGVFVIEDLARPASLVFPGIPYPTWQVVSTWVVRVIGMTVLIAAGARLLFYWSSRTRGRVLLAALVAATVLARRAPAQAVSDTQNPVGVWRGTSLCLVQPSPCKDEVVVYRITPLHASDSVSIDARKIVNAREEEMGILACRRPATGAAITCTMKNGVWRFTVRRDSLIGELRLPDDTKFRDVRTVRARERSR